jgi:hypothetical protein
MSHYSDDELIEELARRRNARELAKPEKWCGDCANFKTWNHDVENDRGAMPDNYNPCQRGHKMQFVVPEGYCDDDYGFYRRVCGDRSEVAA